MDEEILSGFKQESQEILVELEKLIELMEANPQNPFEKELPEYSQKIDRIMGAAKTLSMEAPEHLGLKRIGAITALCKQLGYNAGLTKDPRLLPFFAAFFADTLEVLQELVGVVEDEAKSKEISQQYSSVLQKRLEWLASKVVQGVTGREAVERLLKMIK